MQRKYYEAYDDRYRQVHGAGLQWFYDDPTPIVEDTIREYGIGPEQSVLELGCGEGRDAWPLLRRGYSLLATDISEAAIAFAKAKCPQYAHHFTVLDCVAGRLDERYAFIYAVAVVHMLVEDGDRQRFYRFVRDHLTEDGIALICTMGDGERQSRTDVATAFDLQPRIHEQSGRQLSIASTSCRVVDFPTFRAELAENGLCICKEGITAAPPDFPVLMYAVVRRERNG